jgi:hypothetical protein
VFRKISFFNKNHLKRKFTIISLMKLIMKMKNILIFLASLTLFYCCCKGDAFDDKLCDPSLSDAKIAELEKCDDIYPKEVINFLILLLLIFLCQDI